MTPSEIEANLLQQHGSIVYLKTKVEELQRSVDTLTQMIVKESNHSKEMWAREAEHQREMQDREFLYIWKQRFQFQVLKEMLFESADKLGRTTEQMAAEFDHRWKMRLDENLQRLEDTQPNLAGRVDERSEDELPPM